MSIIHEAMKKTGQPASQPEKQKQPHTILEKKPAYAPKVEVSRPERVRSSANWGPLLVLVVCFLAAGPLLAPHFLKPSALPAPARQFAVEEAPLPVAAVGKRMPSLAFTKREAFTLSGVVYSQKESYCLINGLVLRVGEQIGGATVQKITPDEVVLDVSGRTLTIPVAKG